MVKLNSFPETEPRLLWDFLSEIKRGKGGLKYNNRYFNNIYIIKKLPAQ